MRLSTPLSEQEIDYRLLDSARPLRPYCSRHGGCGMGDMVIVAYRPKPGKEHELLALTRDHVPELRRLGLATDRTTFAMRSKEGIIV